MFFVCLLCNNPTKIQTENMTKYLVCLSMDRKTFYTRAMANWHSIGAMWQRKNKKKSILRHCDARGIQPNNIRFLSTLLIQNNDMMLLCRQFIHLQYFLFCFFIFKYSWISEIDLYNNASLHTHTPTLLTKAGIYNSRTLSKFIHCICAQPNSHKLFNIWCISSIEKWYICSARIKCPGYAPYLCCKFNSL